MKRESLPTKYVFKEGHNKFPVGDNEPPSVGYIKNIKTVRNLLSGYTYTTCILVKYKR